MLSQTRQEMRLSQRCFRTLSGSVARMSHLYWEARESYVREDRCSPSQCGGSQVRSAQGHARELSFSSLTAHSRDARQSNHAPAAGDYADRCSTRRDPVGPIARELALKSPLNDAMQE